jgi:transcription initiation factor TFIIH subunit 1
MTPLSSTSVDEIPDGLFRQMTTCQTAANEFLRQFWTTIYPPPVEVQTLAVFTAAQRTAKAARMIGYISKTHEKVDALIRTAQQHGLDASRVEIVSLSILCRIKTDHYHTQAMKPILDAVDQAISFHRSRS